jgi:hypothetical protein
MCLCVQPYRHNKAGCLDEPAPSSNAKKAEAGRLPLVTDIMMDNQGLNYVAVRNCDLERFSAK